MLNIFDNIWRNSDKFSSKSEQILMKIIRKIMTKFSKTSPFRNRVAKLRGPSEGLGGNAANVWSTQLQAVEQWGAMWYFHITSTRDIFRSERWRSSQMKIVLAVWKMQTPCCHVLVQSVCLVEVQRAGWLSDENMLQFWCCRQCWLFLTDF